MAGTTGIAEIMERHRPELRVHCYRMLGSYSDAEDHVQETFLRAWRQRDSFEGRSSIRTWLYRIATNACLDTLRRSPERVIPSGTGAPSEIPWLEPYPDVLLDDTASAVVAKETIELAFLTAIQVLSPNQRAVLILRDVLDWPAAETAELLDTSIVSVNSTLQRAKATLSKHRPTDGTEWAPPRKPSEDERHLLQRYIAAHDRADASAVVAMLREDVRFTMPPADCIYLGREAVGAFFADFFGPNMPGEIRLVPTRANRQPAAANYLRRPGDDTFRAMSLDVLRFEDGQLAEITTFEPHLFPAFGLPDTI